MISVEQWRQKIGCFCPRARSAKRRPSTITLNKHVMSIGLKCFVLVSMLLLAGDIESNPGPSIEDQFASLTEFVGSGFEEINKNIKDLRQEVSTLKCQFETMQAEFKHKCDIMHAYIDANAEAIETIRDRVSALEATVESQERYSRRENILLHNVKEEDGENFWNIRSKVVNIINKSIDSADKLSDHDVTRAHRLGKSPRTDKPRPIIVRFSNFMDKMKVIKGRQSLRAQGLGVSNDLTKNQRSELDKLKEKGKNWILQEWSPLCHPC